MLKNFSSNKIFLIALGFIAIIGLVIISFNGSQTSKTQISPTPQPSSKNFTTAKMQPIAQSKPVTGQIIVKFKPQYTTAQINADLKQYNASILKQITGINQTVVKVPAGQEDAISQQLKTDPYVDTVQRDYTTHAFFTPNDPNFSFQYGLNNTGQTIQGKKGIAGDDIHAEAAWDVTKGNGIKVAILDTGINLNQPDLTGKVVAEKVFLSQPSPGTDTSSVEDQNGHGTHVAGILAADTNNGVGVAGVCPGCQLIIGRILDNNGDGTTSDSVASITWAADQGAKVINMSLGTPDSSMKSLYAQAVSYAESKGAIVVAAAGNCGGSDYLQEGCTVQNEITYPAGVPGVVSVGATTNTDTKASYSNYGSSVGIAAPGDNILSTGPIHSFDPDLEPFGYNISVPYFYLSGTSMATPYVSGVAALVASTAFGTTPQAIINRLYATADKIAGTGTYWVHGRVDAAAAVGPAPSAPQPSSALITPTVFCVGGKGVSPCQPFPSGTTIVSPASGGGQNSPGVSGAPISGGEQNPSISPSSEENGNVSSSPSPVVSGTPGSSNGNTQVCQNVNVDQAFYNLASQQPATGIKVHIKCESGGGSGGNNGGGNNTNPNNGWLSKFFQFLLELLQLLLQLITQCLPTSNTGTPLPSVAVPSVSTSPAPSVNTVSPATSVPSQTTISKSPAVSQAAGQTTSSSCTNPSQTLLMNASNPEDGVTIGNYYLTNDTWNVTGYQVSQTMYICNYNNWYVIANATDTGDGAIKTYPNVHEDFNEKPISSFNTITSSYADQPPSVGDYDVAYDIWVNGVATSGSTEVMIWTQALASQASAINGYKSIGTTTIDGVTYNVHENGNGYIALQAVPYNTSGTVDLKAVFNYLISKNIFPATSTLGQIDYGVEIDSTNGTNQTFKFTNFSITAN